MSLLLLLSTDMINVISKFTTENYNDKKWRVKTLKSECKKLGIRGYSRERKAEIIQMLINYQVTTQQKAKKEAKKARKANRKAKRKERNKKEINVEEEIIKMNREIICATKRKMEQRTLEQIDVVYEDNKNKVFSLSFQSKSTWFTRGSNVVKIDGFW